ncbi:chromate transporter, chromate ion transporter (CHR) family [Syntrophobacter fumaroxidans MPOB]|uniref:Chromate transporter, chromate ion transporter (CHR) family n=2 Tax=Syntrophobacter TaxID=29526 RepID=A0LEE3_SYNFM|nr:chromate transporter, chromate ion transporter (CHR) family [Syntrophobacter fumaroxidans MPOB]
MPVASSNEIPCICTGYGDALASLTNARKPFMQNHTPEIIAESYPALFWRFLRFGLLAWGGPIAQIAMIRQELVEEEKWVSPERFNRVLGLYQALPGPEAHELCVYFGMVNRGRFGGFLAGLGFMLPGFVLMFLLSWFYLSYGMAIPRFQAVFLGLQAAVGALIVRAIHRIGGHSLTNAYLWGIAAMAVLAEVLGTPFLLTLTVGGAAYLLIKEERRTWFYLVSALFVAGVILAWKVQGSGVLHNINQPPTGAIHAASLPGLFVSGLRSGMLTFGGAYTVIAFLQHDAVAVQAWMTNAQFLDGLALSGTLPAPLIIFATFVGFVAGGGLGALIMTTAIFLPAFGFTLIGHSTLERVIQNERLHAFLDGITAAVVGLMAVTTLNLLRAGIGDWRALGIFALALAVLALWRAKLAIAVVMVAAGAVGVALF